MWKKWLAILRLCITRSFTYRAEAFLWILLDIFPTLIILATWFTLFQGKNVIHGQTFSQLVTYYLSIQLILNVAETHFEERWIENIRYGKIDFFFVKPLTLPIYIFIDCISMKFVGFLMFILPFSITVLIMQFIGALHIAAPEVWQVLMLILFLTMGFLMNFCLSFLIVLLGFWIEEASSISHFKWLLAGTLGGSLAPLTFYPVWIQHLATFFPFERIFTIPASLLTNIHLFTYYLQQYSILTAFVLVAFLVCYVAWNKAVYKYSSAGG